MCARQLVGLAVLPENGWLALIQVKQQEQSKRKMNFDDEDINKKRKRSSNPLAQARKKNDKVGSLWHRKSGAGFRLFAEFYAKQPVGICCGDNIPSSETSRQDKNKITPKNNGQSRAAKRRNKKKNKSSSSSPSATIENAEHANNEESTLLDNNRINERWVSILSEWKSAPISDFLQVLARPLPLTFRIRQTVPKILQEELQDEVYEKFGSLVLSKTPGSRIYQAQEGCQLTKSNVRHIAPLLKEFLVKHSSNGNIARQEFASMLPVLALECGGWMAPQRNNDNARKFRVLDLCASPGSKTMQALEILMLLEQNNDNQQCRLKANDVSETRLQECKNAIGRSGMMHHDFEGILKYSCQDARHFPVPKSVNLLYDICICDVPCSGDGTIRKDPHILPNWVPSTSNALHDLQLSILLRALKCVKRGGIVCYSTCSLNPVEDESVVASALTQINEGTGGKAPSVEILPWPKGMNDVVQCHPGVADWKISDYIGDSMDEDEDEDEEKATLRWHASFKDAVGAQMEHATATMWPPPNVESLNLDRCVRLWPQGNDSGGFFIALIRRNR